MTSNDADGAEVVAVICDHDTHWFSVPKAVLQNAQRISAADLHQANELSEATKQLGRELGATADGIRQAHVEDAQQHPTVEVYQQSFAEKT